MGMIRKIYKLTLPAKVGLFVAACFGFNMSFISPLQAEDVEKVCAVKFEPCKIGGAKESEKLYHKNRVSTMQTGCLNAVPVEKYTRVSEEACLRKGTSKTAAFNHTVNGENYREHQGMDVGAPVGTKVTAAADGWIAKVYSCYGGGGQVVVMRHHKAGGGCYTSTYMHLSSINKVISDNAGKEGTKIKKGTVIALSGRSSCSNGKYIPNEYPPHLHIELRDDPNCKDEKGPILNPACKSIQALCDANAPVTAEPITEYTPWNDGMKPSLGASATLNGCGKMFSENNLAELHQHGESGGNPGAFNKCAAKDTSGGCSYGISQFACLPQNKNADGTMTGGTVGAYLKYIKQTNPSLYKSLEIGGSLQSTINAACTPPATQFASKWAAAAQNDASGFKADQQKYLDHEFYDGITINQSELSGNAKGITLNDFKRFSPEIQMMFYGVSVAAGPGTGPRKMINYIFGTGGPLSNKKPADVTEEELIKAWFSVYPKLWESKYLPEMTKRAAKEEKMALESLAIRKEVKNGKTLEDASKAVTGKRACDEGEYPDVTVKSGISVGSSGGGSSGGSDKIGNEYNANKDCSVENYRNSFTSCIFCDVFRVLFNTASSIAKKSFNALANGVMILVCVGFAIWLCLTIMPFIAAMEQKNPSILIKTILNQAFLILIVVTLLRMDSVKFFQLAMEPLFNTGFKMAQMVNSGVDGQTCQNKYDILTEAQGAGLPESMGVSILCTIETIQGKILDVMALGSSSMCVGFYLKSWFNLPIFPHLGYVLTGILLWLAAFLLMVIYPFLLIDSVLQLCIATALLPAAIGCYAFKFTNKYSKKVWDTFLNCMFNFLFLAIIIFILTNGLSQILPVGEIWQAGTGSSYEIILEEIPWWSPRFLKVIFYMLLGWAVLGEAKSFAGQFSGGISVNDIGSKVGGMAANTATQGGIGAVKGSYKAASKVGGAIKERGREAYNSYKTNRRANKIQNSSKATVDENGNMVLQHRTWTGRKVTDTLQIAADGTRTVTRTKQAIFGNKAQAVSNDQFIRNKKSYDSNGKLIREEMSMNTAAGKTLLNRDGTRNEVAIHAIRSGSGMSNDDIDKAIMNQMMQERMGDVPGADMNQEFAERNVSRSLDESGREVFTVTQTNTDGSTSIFQMTKGNKRDMLTYTRISKNGKAQSYSSDGIINKKSSYKLSQDGKVDAKSVKNNYAFAKNFNSAHTRSMDSNGRMNRNIPADEIMMSDEDMLRFQEQIATYGKDQPMAEFGK